MTVRIVRTLLLMLLAAALLPAPAAAEGPAVPVDQARAIAIVTDTFPIPGGMQGPSAQLHGLEQGWFWEIAWTGTEPQIKSRLTAFVDAVEGRILGFNHIPAASFYRGCNCEPPAPMRYSLDEARQAAQAWVDRLAPELKGSLREQDSLTTDTPYRELYGSEPLYVFTWTQVEQGYPDPSRTLTVTITAADGALRAYSRTTGPAKATYVLPNTGLDETRAYERYRAAQPVALYYKMYLAPGGNSFEWRMAYLPPHGEFPVLEMDGTLTDASGGTFQPMGKGVPVPPAAAPYIPPPEPLTQEQALAVALAVNGRVDDPTQASYDLFNPPAPGGYFRFTWTGGPESALGERFEHVAVDAQAGLIVQYVSKAAEPMPPAPGRAPAITEAEARALAVEFLHTYRPDLAGNALLLEPTGPRPDGPVTEYSVPFAVTHKGVPLDGRWGELRYSAVTGQLLAFQINPWEAVRERFPFVEPETVLTADQAMDALLDRVGLAPMWVAYPSVRLAWVPLIHRDAGLDAVTGDLVDNGGHRIQRGLPGLAALGNHPAGRSMQMLHSAGIINLREGAFAPDKALTVTEAAAWLVRLKGLTPEGNPFDQATKAGLILPEDLPLDAASGDAVPRERFALWAVRAMGYGKIADMPVRIDLDLADRDAINVRHWNAVAILRGLGILTGDQFEPQRPITRGEAAQILLGALNASR
ncbi:MAG TPA: S-layer homology domain-containing protein [Symbiobacteriaceae bacterium]|nr:S-layer homology domain-containing protein [Symbiobacteriaceae bacterium]